MKFLHWYKIVLLSFFLNPQMCKIFYFKNQEKNINIIVVDWEEGAKPTLSGAIYFKAAENTKIVGKKTADLLADLKIDPLNVHCIGHSLGAHCKLLINLKFEK